MLVTLGLAEIMVGEASPAGTMPQETAMKKIGKTYRDSAKFSQETSEVTEHFEEGNALSLSCVR